MVDKYEVVIILGVVAAFVGIGFIAIENPTAAVGAALLALGILTAVVAFMQKVLKKLGMGLGEIL